MVSIPDWSRWSRLYDSQKLTKQNNKPTRNYEKTLELQAIREAKNNGFFLDITPKFLLSQFGDNAISEIKEIIYINLPSSHICAVGGIEYCLRLRVLCLTNNHISTIDALVSCRQLIKLDLSGNQLITLPGPAFWGSLRFLRIVLLHDNPLGTTDSVAGLQGCQHITALTLFDTPLSLRKNYRHHVVNSILALKALDFHVIADEEIIEDAHFGGRFVALSNSLKINPLHSATNDANNYESEMICVKQILKQITHILAHNSPVVIIQRFVRGMLVRKRARKVKSAANVSLISEQSPWNEPTPPAELKIIMNHVTISNAKTSKPAERSSSPVQSEGASTVRKGPTSAKDLLPEKSGSPMKVIITERQPAYSNSPALSVDANSLISGGKLAFLDAEAYDLEMMNPSHDHYGSNDHTSSRYTKVRGVVGVPLPGIGSRLRIMDHRQFFSASTPPDDNLATSLSNTEFRLRGVPPHIQDRNAFEEMILQRVDAGQMVRYSENVYRALQETQTKPTAMRYNFTNNEKRLFDRTQGTMGFYALGLWDKLEKDVKDNTRQIEKTEKVWAARQQRQRSKMHLDLWKKERRERARGQDARDRQETERCLERRKELVHVNNESVNWQRAHRLALHNRFQEDKKFATEFVGQQTAVSTALLNHDRKALSEEKIRARSDVAHDAREQHREKAEEVQRYLEHQRIARQSEIAVQRAALDSMLLAEASDRLLTAHARVAHLKTLRRAFIELEPISATVPDVDRPRATPYEE